MDQNQNIIDPRYENGNNNTVTMSCNTCMATLNDGLAGLNLLDMEIYNADSSFQSSSRGLSVCSLPKDTWYYNMHHKYRGKAIIFNHENFQFKDLEPRGGTELDCINLEASLKKLGFDVIVYVDLTLDELNKALDYWVNIDYTDNDCFLMAVLSHGYLGKICAKDTEYPEENLWNRFTDIKCSTLVGKPKLFFIQACRGDQLDSGVQLRTHVDGAFSFNIKNNSDFLIAHSTILGFTSWRNHQNGSWFIKALSETFDAYGFELDILTILTLVNRKVADDYESRNSTKKMKQKKQMPCIIISTLTKNLKFEEKY